MLPVCYSINEVSEMLTEFLFSWHWLPRKRKPLTCLTVYVQRNIHRSYNFFFDDDKLGLSGQQKLSIRMIFKVVKKQAWPDDELCLKFRWDSSSLFISKSMARQILSKSKHLFMVEKPRSSNTCSTTTKSTRTLTTLIVSHDVQACGRLEHQEDNLAVKSLIRVQEL